MIFDGKVLAEVSNEDISQLVKGHVGERQHLEYKKTIDHKSDPDRFETLCDIASLANAGGGYLIIGIRDDGKGNAQKFESAANSQQIKQAVLALCIDHIAERIDGLEIECRTVDGNDIIIIRIPSSNRIPHMVNYQNKTHFVTRYHDGKREMTIGEIRAAFTEDLFGKKLTLIEEGLRSLLSGANQAQREALIHQLTSGETTVLNITDGAFVATYLQNKTLKTFERIPLFYISITPTTTKSNLIDIDGEEIKTLMDSPPNQRDAGWTMRMFASDIQYFAEGLYHGDPEERILVLMPNGHMEFYTVLDTLFCWQQSDDQFRKQPRLYPHAVTEFPCSFLRLYKAILDNSGLNGSFIIKMHYQNLKGYSLLPFQPQSIGYLIRQGSPNPFGETNLILSDVTVNHDFNPDEVAYELLKHVYHAYGYTPDKIPFYNKDIAEFSFGS